MKQHDIVMYSEVVDPGDAIFRYRLCETPQLPDDRVSIQLLNAPPPAFQFSIRPVNRVTADALRVVGRVNIQRVRNENPGGPRWVYWWTIDTDHNHYGSYTATLEDALSEIESMAYEIK